MWSDTLLLAERAWVLRVLVWGGACALLGTTLLVFLAQRPRSTRLLAHFAIQTAAWGMCQVIGAVLWWRALTPRDIAGAERLDDMLWFLAGLETGIVMAALAMIAIGWRTGKRLSILGAGTAIVVQGLALLLLNLHTLARIATLRIA